MKKKSATIQIGGLLMSEYQKQQIKKLKRDTKRRRYSKTKKLEIVLGMSIIIILLIIYALH